MAVRKRAKRATPNPQDTTLRNVRAANRKIAKLMELMQDNAKLLDDTIQRVWKLEQGFIVVSAGVRQRKR